MDFVREDESPNKHACHRAVHRRLPGQTATAAQDEQQDAEQRQHADRDRPLGVGRVGVPTGRVAVVHEQAEPEEDHGRPDHLPPADHLTGQEVAHRQHEDHRRHEQRLDDREASSVERAGLERVPREQRHGPHQPRRLTGQPHQRHRVGHRDRREVQRSLLLERGRDCEEERRHERQTRSHAATLGANAAGRQGASGR